MADIKQEQSKGVPRTMITNYRDQGDGTHALVGTSRIERLKIVESVTIPNGQSLTSRWIDMRNWAALGIQFPEAMDGSHFQIYGRMLDTGIEEKAVWDTADALIIQPIENGIVPVNADLFVVPWVKIQSCSDAAGTPQNETAERTLLIVKVP